MKRRFILFIFHVLLFCGSVLLAVPEIPIRAEKGLTQTQIQEIYTEIKDYTDGIQVCKVLERYGWYTEAPIELSSTPHPYVAYKMQIERLGNLYASMEKREFEINMAYLQDLFGRAYRRGLREKEIIVKLASPN